ncbi:MAG: thiamine phosphate synthase [Ignavibacteria bacterium]|nr:thiamine phosphate synthase [Ignavibacteria bacterium]
MKNFGRLYLITDTNIQNKLNHYEIAKLAVKNGVDILQLREKCLPSAELAVISSKISKLCKKNGVTFLVNDRVDIAVISDADGVHLGNSDIPVKDARKILGKRKIIGATAHNLKEALLCEKNGADYIGYGHIYPTKTKFKPQKPKGIKNLKKIVNKIKIPVIAIGGISLLNIENVLSTGVHGIAVIGAVLKSKHPSIELKVLRKKIYGYKYGNY